MMIKPIVVMLMAFVSCSNYMTNEKKVNKEMKQITKPVLPYLRWQQATLNQKVSNLNFINTRKTNPKCCMMW